jgi:hypothetical protein
MLERNKLKEEKFIFDLQFQRFLSMVDWPHCCGPEVRQSIMTVEAF